MARRASRRTNAPFKYHAALSFAGENRGFARRLAGHLTRDGHVIFFDENRQANLWGKSSGEFEQVYGRQTQFVIPVVSRHYVRKDWTRYEFEIAKREARRRGTEFILPITLDDTPLLGLHDDVIRIDGRRHSAKAIAELFSQKIRSLRRVVRTANGRPKILLDPRLRGCLSLVATAIVPLPTEAFQKLFPKIDWADAVRRMRRAGLIKIADGLVVVSRKVTASLRSDVTEWRASRDTWLTRLAALAAHPDTGAMLAVQLLLAKRVEESARVIVEIAQSSPRDSWNPIYRVILNALLERRHFNKLKRQTQLEVLNALGQCLLASGKLEEASSTFRRLRALSTKHRSAWGLGQALLHTGVTAHKLGDDEAAARSYKEAATHAKRVRDRFLLGRALSNLAQIYLDTDSVQAERHLKESIRAKRRARDTSGLVVALATTAGLAAAKRDFDGAARGYKEAARAARQSGLRYELALSTYNHGRSLDDAGKRHAAIKQYARARLIAAAEDYFDISALALNALGQAAFALRRFAEMGRIGAELVVLSKTTRDVEQEVAGLHMLACSRRARRRPSARAFAAALAATRKIKDQTWVVRCLVDGTRAATKAGLGAPDVNRLRQHARRATGQARHDIAARLWQVVAELESAAGAAENASVASELADQSFRAVRRLAQERVDHQKAWYARAWAAGRPKEALIVLQKLERMARAVGNDAEAIAALDQRAQCLQDMGLVARAEPLHRAAVHAARQAGGQEQLERSLNNLGEAMRRLNRPEESLVYLAESERMARRASRHEGALVALTNRALALKILGRYADARRCLATARREASRRRLWLLCVRSTETSANLEWHLGHIRIAMSLYRRALSMARVHRVREAELSVALNLAKLLHSSSKPQAALRLLSAYERALPHGAETDAVGVLATLAELHESRGQMRKALALWVEARTRAARTGSSEEQKRCETGEVRIRRRVELMTRSDASRLDDIRKEQNTESRASLMLDRFESLLAKDAPERAAQHALDDGLAYCAKHSLHRQCSQFYMAVGDHCLSKSFEGQLNACKAYVMAVVAGLGGGASLAGEALAHTFNKLALPDSPIAPKTLNRLVDAVASWLTADFSPGPEAKAFLMSPFIRAQRLAPLRHRPAAFLEALDRSVSAPNR